MTLCALTMFDGACAASDTVLPPIPDHAVSYNVSPIRIELDHAAHNVVFRVQNDGHVTLPLEARVFAWTQQNGADHYTQTSDLVASPAIVEIEPGQSQIFRLVRLHTPASTAEIAYRVVLDQLPSDAGGTKTVAETRLRMTVPVLVDGDTADLGNLSISPLDRSLIIRNAGGRSIHLTQLGIQRPHKPFLALGTPGPRYVLARSEISWAMPESIRCLPSGSTIEGAVDHKPFHATLAATCA